MTLRPLISLSLLLAALAARAQTAEDFFNSGAQFYISNNIPQALAPVEEGLKRYPDDVKLKKLYELLKQQQQSQNNQSQQNQQNQSQQQQNQQNSQEQQKQNEQNQSGRKNDEQKKKQQQPSSGDKQNGQKQENQNEPGQPVTAGQMTPEEAKRLLDAQKGDEQVLQLKPQGKPENPNRPIKDW
jgi:hypothetical protein